jgi:hypothetical protein
LKSSFHPEVKVELWFANANIIIKTNEKMEKVYIMPLVFRDSILWII